MRSGISSKSNSTTSSRVSSASARRENAALARAAPLRAYRFDVAPFRERHAAALIRAALIRAALIEAALIEDVLIDAVVEHAETHAQVRRQLQAVEIARADLDAGHAAQVRGEHARERFVARRLGLRERAREIGCGDKVAAQRLRQSADEFGNLLGEQPGHEPLAARGRHRVDERQRHVERDAVCRVAGHEAVVELSDYDRRSRDGSENHSRACRACP